MGVFLNSLILEDFRNFSERAEIKFVSSLTAIVGKNSTGKSSVLSAIEYLASGKKEEEFIGRIEGIVGGRRIAYPRQRLKDVGVYLLKLRSTRGVSEAIRVDYPDKSSPDFVRLIQGFDFGEVELERLNRTCCHDLGFELRREDSSLNAVFKNGRSVPANKLSAGVQSVLALEAIFLITLKNPERRYLILLEEVENFLHPSQLRRIIEKLKRASSEERYQIILTTHSPLVVSMLSPESVVRMSPDGKIHQLKSISEKMIGDWKKLLDPVKSEVFFADKVIIYEGLTDKMIIEGALRSEGIDPSVKDVVSIKLDGLYHYESITEILRNFEIPYLSIVDKDPKGRTKETLKGKFITLMNPYGEIEDAIPLEDWIRILKNTERDAEISFLINLLDKSFGRFSDAVSMSFGKNKLSYAYRLGKLYEISTGIRDRGVGTFVKAIEDFLIGREIKVEVKGVDKDINSKSVMILEEGFGLAKNEVIEVLWERDLFPGELLPFFINRKHYGLLTRKALPALVEARIPFVVALRKDYDLNHARRYLERIRGVEVEWREKETLRVSVEGIDSFIATREGLSLEDLLKLADFDV